MTAHAVYCHLMHALECSFLYSDIMYAPLACLECSVVYSDTIHAPLRGYDIVCIYSHQLKSLTMLSRLAETLTHKPLKGSTFVYKRSSLHPQWSEPQFLTQNSQVTQHSSTLKS